MFIRAEKIKFFESVLLDFFRKAGREELPWRKKGMTAYAVWVSEIMLQQTQVTRVIGYYVRFLERFPTVESLAEASWEEFLPYYEGLGYYARGRNMLRAAQAVVTEYNGVFPRDLVTLQTIPGIGPYTAAAITSFVYGDRHLAWDTNLHRVVGRFFLGTKKAMIDTDYFESKFTSPRKKLNAALMDFGSALCAARPKCEACPLRTYCRYYREKGMQETQLIRKKVAKKPAMTNVEVIVTLHEKHRTYYSSRTSGYAPFTLPKGYVTRADIKAYFQKKYGLTIAVRPPHGEEMRKGKRYQLINAQILLGKPMFREFPPEIARKEG
ncbi:MAG: hypothetical protein ACEQSB_04490 [Undibacterium sp.]